MKAINMASINWQKGNGLVPAIIQNATTMDVLMLGYMNEESLKATIETGFVTFFSRSQQQLWQKGETSGNRLSFISLTIDCDNDSLLIKAHPAGPVCHTGDDTCFGNKAKPQKKKPLSFLNDLEAIIKQRATQDPDISYTAKLTKMGVQAIAKKVGEEGVEVALAGAGQSKKLLLEETADLLFHLLLLLQNRKCSISGAVKILEIRHLGQ